MMSKVLSGHWREEVALDLGTATIRLASGRSQLIEQPSRIDNRRALRDGVVVDCETAIELLKPLLDRARMFGVLKPRVVACAPSDANKHERQSLIDSVLRAGAASVAVIPEPLAAAVGSGMDVSSPYAQLVVDIGEGVTDCAVIRSGRIGATCANRVGCGRMRQSIVALATHCGSAGFCDADGDALLRACGVARSPDLPGSVLAAVAVQPVLEEIGDTVDSFLRDLPAEVGCEIIESGICLTGGGALIPGVPEYLEERTGIGLTVGSAPRDAVVEGARAMIPVIISLNEWR
jgi:rod shape-determining protein MreB